MFSRSESNDNKRRNIIQNFLNENFGQRNILHQLVNIPILGHFLTLIIGVSIPYWFTILFFYIIGIGNDEKYLLPVEAFVVFLWNYFLNKKLNTNLLLPIIPIPFWVAALILSFIFFIQNYFL
jgi:hypothetical protein